ncbi:hypothetical protein ABIC28_002633 [Rhodococcus sp. PvR044]|uniref:hypothetical protein n=1 Tax=Rhodococcus sp. PvR044 TaxID=3156402 RepID=UPI0033935BC2
MDVEGKLATLDFDEDALLLGVEDAPWVRVPRRSDRGKVVPDEYVVQYTKSWLQLPWTAAVPSLISRAQHLSARQAPAMGAGWHTSEYADAHYNEAHHRKRASGGGIRWYWGKDDARPEITVIRAFRDGDPEPLRVLELRDVRVIHGAVASGRLWLVVRPETHTGEGRYVITCTVDSGTVNRVGAADGLDISAHCRPVGPQPLDHDSYVQYCLRKLDGFRFSDHVSNVEANYVGTWPDGRIHLRFTHTHYPGLTLVARLNLYDEGGERLKDIMKYARVELMEQAGTRAYPPVTHAVDGVLYV